MYKWCLKESYKKAKLLSNNILNFLAYCAFLFPFVIFPINEQPWYFQAFKGAILLIGSFIILYFFALVYCVCKYFIKHDKEITDLGANKKLRAIVGNIFDKKIIESNERNNIVISFNRCFDTQVDDSLISKKSLHGQLINRLIASKKYTKESLDEAIRYSLEKSSLDENLRPEEIKKRFGKNFRYPLGAVAEIPGINNELYFCLGLSKFDQETAIPTEEEYVVAIMRLIEYIKKRSQEYPVYIPIIGTGLSHLGISEERAFNLLTSLLSLSKNEIICDVYIVLRKEHKELLFIE